MKKYICKSENCGREFDEAEYKLTKNKNKCIFHCKKNKKNGWIHEFYIPNKDKRKEYENKKEKWNYDYIKLFWEYFIKYKNYYESKDDFVEIILYRFIFPIYWEYSYSHDNIVKIFDKRIMFDKCTFLDRFELMGIEDEENSISSLVFRSCIFQDVSYLSNLVFNGYVSFLYCRFKEKFLLSGNRFNKFFEIVNCYINVDLYLINNTSVNEIDIKVNEFFHSANFRGDGNKLKSIKFSHNKNLNLVSFEETEIEDVFFFQVDNLNELILDESTFHCKVKIQFCKIKDNTSFYNTKFEDLADFYQTEFNQVNFERTDFKGITVFSEGKFENDVNFKYTKFLDKAIFRDTVIKGKLNLRDTIFDDEANFLDISSIERDKNESGEYIGDPQEIQVANRETARIIKNYYEQSNNIIEANRFYKIEMQEKSKELNPKKNFLEWLIFKLHDISSMHSQNWILALFWIFLITFSIGIFESHSLLYLPSYIILSFILLGFTFEFKKRIFIFNLLIFSIGIIFYLLYSLLTGDYVLNDVANKINPFSTMNEDHKITFGVLFYKVVIAYFIYQFIVSIRQNTRRK